MNCARPIRIMWRTKSGTDILNERVGECWGKQVANCRLMVLAKLVLVTAIVGTACGCAATSQRRPIASESTLEPGNALIKVERIYNFVGGGRKIAISDNGELIGSLASDGGVLVWQRPAGEMQLNGYRSKADPLIVQVVGGKVYEFTVGFQSSSGFGGSRLVFQSK